MLSQQAIRLKFFRRVGLITCYFNVYQNVSLIPTGGRAGDRPGGCIWTHLGLSCENTVFTAPRREYVLSRALPSLYLGSSVRVVCGFRARRSSGSQL